MDIVCEEIVEGHIRQIHISRILLRQDVQDNRDALERNRKLGNSRSGCILFDQHYAAQSRGDEAWSWGHAIGFRVSNTGTGLQKKILRHSLLACCRS